MGDCLLRSRVVCSTKITAPTVFRRACLRVCRFAGKGLLRRQRQFLVVVRGHCHLALQQHFAVLSS